MPMVQSIPQRYGWRTLPPHQREPADLTAACERIAGTGQRGLLLRAAVIEFVGRMTDRAFWHHEPAPGEYAAEYRRVLDNGLRALEAGWRPDRGGRMPDLRGAS